MLLSDPDFGLVAVPTVDRLLKWYIYSLFIASVLATGNEAYFLISLLYGRAGFPEKDMFKMPERPRLHTLKISMRHAGSAEAR